MSRRSDTVVLGSNAPTLDVFVVERNSHAYWTITIELPDLDAAIISTDTIETAIMHFRQYVTDATPKLILGTAPDRSGITLTRPNPNQVIAAIVITPEQTNDDLDLTPIEAAGLDAQRVGFPNVGLTDLKMILSDDDEHYVVRAPVRADVMITRESTEPP